MSKCYLGIDVHKKVCVFTEIDSGGKILHRGKFGNTLEEVSDFASTLSPNLHLVLEPVLNYLWLLDQFEPYVGSVHVATPHKVRVIAESKCKTDKYDSHMLAELLRNYFLTIPGIGRLRSAVVYAEIGHVRRFHSAKALASYTGLTPSVRSSGHSVWTGGITRLGSRPLRHALVEASINAIRKSPELNRMFCRILYRSNVQKARVAVARKPAVIIYAMLEDNEPFRAEVA
jgi:transposase